MPLVTVIMPAYNAEAFLREAIDSVLAQTFRDFELIVVDDGSQDRTEQIARSYTDPRVSFLKQENRGHPAARNLALRAAKGSWIAFLDADDIWFPQKLERQVSFAQANPQYGIVTTDTLRFDETGVLQSSIRDRLPIENGWVMEKLLLHNWISNSAVMVRRECFDRAGGFDEEPGIFGADWMMWVQIAQHDQVYFMDEVLVRYRVHAASYTHRNTERQFENLFRNLEKLRQRVPRLAERPELLREAAYRICVNRGRADIRALQLENARRKLHRGLTYRWYGVRAWAWLLVASLPQSVLGFLQRVVRMGKKPTQKQHPTQA